MLPFEPFHLERYILERYIDEQMFKIQ